MSSIIISYLGIIIVNHIKAGGMPEFHNLSHISLFFYSPFCDFYFLRSVRWERFDTLQKIYAILNDGFGFLILVVGTGILIYRRFVKRAYIFKMKWEDVFGVIILSGWFAMHFLATAVTILAFNVPDDIAKYWFFAYVIAKSIAPLEFFWIDFSIMLWCLAATFLGLLIGSIPFNRKLWHIFCAPIVMVANSLSLEENGNNGSSEMPFSKRQILEIDACVKCGICADHCVVYKETKDEHSVIGGVSSQFERRLKQRYGYFSSLIDYDPPTDEEQKRLSKNIYTCTLCGRCKEVCPIMINTRSLRISMRENAVREKIAPASLGVVLDGLKKEFNVLNYPNKDRLMWAEFSDVPQDVYLNKRHAETIYFVGCMTSFSPAISNIAEANLKLLSETEDNFALLGENEYCCGFPLIVAGLSSEWQWLRTKNVETIKSLGAKRIIFNCASCYHTFKHRYQELLPDVSFLHNVEYLSLLLKEKRITFEGLKARVTYHDPCDLGRGCGVFEEPRMVIKAISGIEYKELECNRRYSTCCGGGGDLEMIDAALVNKIASSLVKSIEAREVDIVTTACGQCKRIIQGAIKDRKAKIKVMDIAELVLSAGIEKRL